METVIINICIGLIAVIGFFWYWGKTSGIFKEGGFVYEWWIKKHPKKEKIKKEENNENEENEDI